MNAISNKLESYEAINERLITLELPIMETQLCLDHLDDPDSKDFLEKITGPR